MLTARENFLAFFTDKPYDYVPVWEDIKSFYPEEIPENIARGFVWQEREFDRSKFGGKGFFNIEWEFEASVGGSIEVKPLFDDISEWRDYVVFPNLDEIDWEGMAKRNAGYLNTEKILRTSIFSGFYERLISFVGFENAAMALVDEDELAEVHEIFEKLCEIYCDFIRRMHKYCNVEIFELHDDWGTQKSTMFSKMTLEEVILPYIKRVVDFAHSEGCLIEMHSCGHVDDFVPCMIDAGIDFWRGQATAIDKPELIRKYGDKFHLSYEIRPADETAPLSDILAEVRKLKKEYNNTKIWYMVSVYTDKQIARAIYDELKKPE